MISVFDANMPMLLENNESQPQARIVANRAGLLLNALFAYRSFALAKRVTKVSDMRQRVGIVDNPLFV